VTILPIDNLQNVSGDIKMAQKICNALELIRRKLKGRDLPKMPKNTNASDGHKSPLADYLEYYCSLSEPRFAVLVTGDWGTGKTYQVRQALGPNKYYYVSLFGLNSPERITAAVYAAMFPTKGFIKHVSETAKDSGAELGVFGINLGGLPSALMDAILGEKVKNDRPIIFDDLERCKVGMEELLGVINRYVEHFGCRVIIIAHDEKIADHLISQKEKVIGQTIRIEPQTEAAFDTFVTEVPDGVARNLLIEQRKNILEIFLASEVHSLRILRQVVKDLVRLFNLLTPEQVAHPAAISELTKLFCAFSFEIRCGRLQEKDLRNRSSRLLRYFARKIERAGEKAKEDADDKPQHMIAQERYTTIQLDSELLPEELLISMLIRGHFNGADIQSALQISRYFIKQTSGPPWRIVMNFEELEDDIVQKGIQDMERQFENREVTDPGELLHIFALRMLLATNGILAKDVDGVVEECRNYIDDILETGRLPPREMTYRWREEVRDGAHGYTFWIQEEYKERFEMLRKYLLEARTAERDRLLPECGEAVLAAMMEDGQQFFEVLCHTRTGNNTYADVPVLVTINPEKFVQQWKLSPVRNWHWISSALKQRYTVSIRDPDLAPEQQWIRQVAQLWSREAHKTSGIAGLRMRRRIPDIPLDDN